MMLQRVELLGSMGAGKTTLFKNLLKLTRRRSVPFTLSSAKKEKEAVLLRESRRRSVLHYLALRTLFRVPSLRAALLREKITASAWRALESRQHDLGPVIHHLFHERSERDGNPTHNLRRLDWFIRDLTDVVLLEAHGEPTVLLHDESLLQRGLGFGFGTRNGYAEAERYFTVVPLPTAVIHLTGSPAVLAERIRTRDGPKSRKLAHVDEVCQLSTAVCKILRQRHLPVVQIDALGDPLENARHALEELQKVLRREEGPIGPSRDQTSEAREQSGRRVG